jgi:hypothetical protein
MKERIWIGALGLAVVTGIGTWLDSGLQALQAPQPVNPAAAQEKHCDFTYIFDKDRPNIGEDGAIKYDASWQKMVDGGWSLKSAMPIPAGGFYFFEKCR